MAAPPKSALAYEAGVPALDGLGPVGGGFHSDKEYLDLTTVYAAALSADQTADESRREPARTALIPLGTIDVVRAARPMRMRQR